MKFLTAEWRKLAIINYEINPEILEKYLPQGTELDFFQGKCLISLIGFMFLNTKLMGIPVPFHRDFEEVNLRFYVKRFENNSWKRGVVFIKEIVPKFALSFVANTIYKEHYETRPMKHSIVEGDNLHVTYQWKNSKWNSLEIIAENKPFQMIEGSDFEFITEHYFGYTKRGQQTSEYGVWHPKWEGYPVINFSTNIDFEEVYGKNFQILNHMKPHSAMLAEGSEIEVFSKTRL